MNNSRKPNRLLQEKSPYLLQHAYNPVNWFPWSKEAFEKAKQEEKPIFLSIGYSTCHWCHVMAHESFEDKEVAEYLNTWFISIKVDREERPDIDAVYMDVCQAMTGGGGWPLTVFLTPEQKPFFAGTYFPKRQRYGQPGLLELLTAVQKSWKTERGRLYTAGEEISEWFRRQETSGTGRVPDSSAFERAEAYFEQVFDSVNGGFGAAPKFPSPHNLLFLLRFSQVQNSDRPLQMVKTTLHQMYRGGIFDQIGFGFSRYSTDAHWLAPHFEKMLYDNALLVMALTETYAVTGDPLFRSAAEQTLAYIDREMTAPEGGFYSAQDADSDGEEGRYYTFTPDEIKAVLGESDANQVCRILDITEGGNFEGRSIPNLLHTPDGMEVKSILLRARPKLLEYRRNRAALHKDDKILTAWNALMIAAYSKASRIFGNETYLAAALRARDFLRQHLIGQAGELSISYRDGKASGNGLLQDYAFLAWADLELYEATFDCIHLESAVELAKAVLSRFADVAGGYYLNTESGESLIFRPKEQYDGAIPSGNSVFAYCLMKLALLTGEPFWQKAADRQLEFYADGFDSQPQAFCFALLAFLLASYPTNEAVCVLREEKTAGEALQKLRGLFSPQTSILVKTAENAERLAEIAPFTRNYKCGEEHAAAFYLCRNQSCLAPQWDVEELLRKL